MKPKIKIRKSRDGWFVSVPGDIPDFSRHGHFSDAVAKAQFEFREAYHMKALEQAIIAAMEELEIIDTRRFGEVVLRHVLPVFEQATDLTFEAGKVLQKYQDTVQK